ncbi:hypothetical protein BN1708_019676, partial [Verticillium longisporum]
RTAPST